MPQGSPPKDFGSGVPNQQPAGPGVLSVPPARPATSNVEHAAQALGDLLNLAFRDAIRVDQLARQATTAFANLDHDQRISLGEQHPRLLESLLLIEDCFERIDRR